MNKSSSRWGLVGMPNQASTCLFIIIIIIICPWCLVNIHIWKTLTSCKGKTNTYSICLHKNVTCVSMPLNVCLFFDFMKNIVDVLWGEIHDPFGDNSRKDLKKVGHKNLETDGHKDLETMITGTKKKLVIGTWRKLTAGTWRHNKD